MNALAYRTCRTAFVSLALFGAAAHLELVFAGSFSPGLLGVALLLGIALEWVRAAPPARTDVPRTPIAGALVAVTLLAVVAAAIAYGSLATPARHWDGIVSWEAKAIFLTDAPSIDQAYFRDPGVYCHSRDYPLLQPILVASGNRLLGEGAGRSLFPLLYLLLCTTVGSAITLAARRRWSGMAAALALGITPMLANPSLGSADSGMADLFMATCLAGCAAGLLLRDPWLLGAAACTALMVKPEALVYAALPVAILWFRGERTLLWGATLGWLGGAALVIPLQSDLQHFGDPKLPPFAVWGVLGLLGCLLMASDTLFGRSTSSLRARWIGAVALVPVVLAALPAVAMASGDASGTVGIYLQDLQRPIDRLSRLPGILLGMLDYGIFRLSFALTFVLPVLLLWRSRRRRQRLEREGQMVGWFLLLGLACLLLPFLLSPEPDLRHHLRSSMARLLLQWIGPLWMLNLLWIDRQTEPDLQSAPTAP